MISSFFSHISGGDSYRADACIKVLFRFGMLFILLIGRLIASWWEVAGRLYGKWESNFVSAKRVQLRVSLIILSSIFLTIIGKEVCLSVLIRTQFQKIQTESEYGR